MAKEKRPDRNWKEYNEHLVQRGEILLDIESLQSWQGKVHEMNLGKSFGLPPQPDAVLRNTADSLQPPLPLTGGLARGLGKLISIPAPNYGIFSLRLPKLDLDPYQPKEGKEVVIAMDAMGITVTNREEWMRRERNKLRLPRELQVLG